MAAQTSLPSVADAVDVRPRVGRELLLLLGYAALALWWLWPAPRFWATHSAYDPGGMQIVSTADFYLIVWAMSWVAHAVWRSPLQLFDANTFYPAPLTLAYSEHLIGFLPLFGPLYWLTGNPILALNVTAFLTYPLGAWFTYLFARRYVAPAAAALSGVFYVFCAARYLAGSHFHMLGVQYLPLILYGLDGWLRDARPRDAALLALALLLQALSSVYLMYAVLFVSVVAAPLAALQHRQRIDRRRVIGLAVVAGVVGVVLLLVMQPYLTLRELGLVPQYGDDRQPVGLIPAYARLHLEHYLLAGGVGWLGYALALLGVLPGGPARGRFLLRVGVALAATGLFLALGPGIATSTGWIWSPYALLMELIPGFSSVRAPIRFTVIAQLGFSLLAGLGLGRILRGRRPALAWSVAAACAAAVVAGRLALPEPPLHREAVGDDVPPVYRWLAAHGEGRAVLEVPRAANEADAARRAYFSTYHWSPIVDGYGAYPPQHRRYLALLARRLPQEEAFQQIVDLIDVGWIVVHRDSLADGDAERWRGPLPEGLTPAAEWPSGAVYRVHRPVRDDRRALLLSTERTLRGTAIAPLGESCDGELRFLGWAASPIVAGGEARARLRLENRSGATWPAVGFYPRNLVLAEFALRDASGARVGKRDRTTLNDDPRPFVPTVFSVWFRVPAQPGRYTLEVELVQQRVKRLAECGLAPLEVPFEVVPRESSGGAARLELLEQPRAVRVLEDAPVQHRAQRLAREARVVDRVPVDQRRPHRIDDLGAGDEPAVHRAEGERAHLRQDELQVRDVDRLVGADAVDHLDAEPRLGPPVGEQLGVGEELLHEVEGELGAHLDHQNVHQQRQHLLVGQG
ncbi:MAG: hypothetical protein AB1689_28980 [Thermodesulfobacteriota bacterium]